MEIKQNKKIIASGGVIYRKTNGGEIIICHRAKTNLYALPKGKSEYGENIENTALREVLAVSYTPLTLPTNREV